MATLEFFFDCSSPWTYLAFTRLPALLERTKAAVVWRPILVGGVFNEVNRDVYDRRANPEPRKASYYEKDFRIGHVCAVSGSANLPCFRSARFPSCAV